jgi:hypothetical protein
MEQTTGATIHHGSDRRTWLIGAIAVAALVAIAAVAVVLTGSRDDAVYEPGSPEAVVQAYADAWADGDADAAWEILTPGAQARVRETEFRSAASWQEEMPTRMWIDERRDLDDRVVLVLSVEWTWDGLLGPDRNIQPLSVALIELDGAWRIDTPLVGFYRW